MSAADSSRPAGSPSTITTRARPCDSPAVRKRNITGKRTGGSFGGPRPVPRRADEVVAGVEDDVDRADRHRGAAPGHAASPPGGTVEHAGTDRTPTDDQTR